MPLINEDRTPQHQVLVNQSMIKRVDADIKVLKKDIEEIKEVLLFLKKYTEIKKAREDKRWF